MAEDTSAKDQPLGADLPTAGALRRLGYPVPAEHKDEDKITHWDTARHVPGLVIEVDLPTYPQKRETEENKAVTPDAKNTKKPKTKE